ncbi:transcription factor UNE10 [Rhododendron vialii]|uniref:transcription factor UNE10 n=1 Tax=Rhododendron vialii TaxID=182163 RepID=UPI00265F2427|nr:transcription factor UNE10 [Rhododendron vialii]
MSQCVPSWEVDENPSPPRLSSTLRPHSNSNSIPPDVIPMLDYEVAELTWENGQLAMHGLGPPRVPTKYPNWDKPRAGGTLESIVNPVTYLPQGKSGSVDELVPWFDHHRPAASSASATMTMDALVPCSTTSGEGGSAGQRTASAWTHVMDGLGKHVVGCSTRVGSCSEAKTCDDEVLLKRARVAHTQVAAQEWSCSRDNNSVDGSAACGRESWQLTLDTCDRELGTVGGFTTTSMESLGNTTSSALQSTKATTTATTDDHDSVGHSRFQKRKAGDAQEKKKGGGKSSISTKRSRAAAIHNQSERKRRDKINQRMKTLQKLVPNSSKTDKASMLDEVIEYLKQLQAQISMMSRMNMSSMMLPMTTLQQQLQLSMMAAAPLGMGMGMGMGCMDINTLGRHNIPGIPPVLHPAATAFVPITSWDGTAGNDRLPPPAGVIPDPMSAFLACQSSQPMSMDAYSRMAALYHQQMHQTPPSGTKN